MKRKILLFITAIISLAIMLASCSKDPVKVKTLTVKPGTIQTEYTVGDTPDFSAVEAVVTYSDGSVKEVKAADLVIGTIDTSTAGEKKLTVSYSGFSTEVTITVKEAPVVVTLTGIKILENTLESTAFIGSSYDISKLQVEAVYSDKTTKPIKNEDLKITTIDTSSVGEKVLTVEYEGFKAEFKVTVSGIKSMTVDEDSVSKKISVGDTLDTSNLKLVVMYDNGKSEIVDASALTFSELDTSTYGDKKLTITYKGAVTEYTITVVGLVSIEVDNGSVATSVKLKETLDVSRITAKANYSDGTIKPLATSDLSIKSIDTTTGGVKELVVTYGGVSTTVNVLVIGVKSIAVTSGLKTEILVDETLDTSAVTALITFTDDSSVTISAAALKFGEFDSSEAGTKPLTITYLDKTESVNVKVCGIESIRVEGINKVLQSGKELDISGLKVFAIYEDTDKTEKEITKGYTTNYESLDFNSEENKDFIVTYEGLTATVKIAATSPALTAITLRTYNTYVAIGGVYDKSKVTVIAYYENETTEIIQNANLVISDVATGAAGNVTLTVSYTENEITKSTEATVKVLPISDITVENVPAKVNKGEEFDISDIKITLVTYSDGVDTITTPVDLTTGFSVSNVDTTVGGDKDVIITYNGFEKKLTTHVKAISEIKILGGVTNVRYGYSVDYKNIVIEITYTDKTTETRYASAVNATITNTETTAASGTYTVSVTLDGKSATAQAEILKLVSIDALNGTIPASMIVGASLPLDKIKLTAIYQNAAGETFTYLVGTDDPNLTLSDFDSSSAGEKALVLELLGYSTSVRIMVNGVHSIDLVPGSIETVVKVGATLETAEIKVRVNYTDGTYIYVTTESAELKVGTIDTSTTGIKLLKVTYQGVTTDININVIDVSIGQDDLIFGALLPDNLVSRESYKKNYTDQNQLYVVGDDNLYKFYLNLIVLDAEDNLVDVDGAKRESLIKIYDVTSALESNSLDHVLKNEVGTLIVDTTEGVNLLSELVTVDAKNNTYDFADAAIGRCFKLVVHPKSGYVDEAAVTKAHVVKVVDGYNIYDAKELNLITNASDDMNDGDIMMDPEHPEYDDQLYWCNKFLADNGIARPAVLNGVVLHGNHDLKLSDFPAEYFYSYTKNGEKKIGLYDQVGLYNHEYNTTHKEFSVYGNYFSIYSYNIPSVVENGVANNDDAFSSANLFKFTIDNKNLPSVTFDSASGTGTIAYDPSEVKTNIYNLAMRDNDPNSNDQSASVRHMLGLIAMRFREHTGTIYNVNVDAYMTSITVESDFTVMNVIKSKLYNAWQNHILLWNDNDIQIAWGYEDYDTFAGHQPVKFYATDSLLAKCGGPVIIAQSDDHATLKCNKKSGADAVIDGNSTIYSYVTGTEAWFVAVGQTPLAANIMAMNGLIQKSSLENGTYASYTAKDKIQGVSTVNMIYLNMGTGTTLADEGYIGTLTIGSEVALNMTNNQMLDIYKYATGGQAPIYQSSAGGTAFADPTEGVQNCFGINLETKAPTTPSSEFFQGNYITLYYMGVGLVLEYYH